MSSKIKHIFCFAAATAFIALSASTALNAQVVLEDREPEAATGLQHKVFDSAEQYMVAAANPYAAKAGKSIIEQGGSAIDAAIAIQAMLTLVEPQSSGIGGGAFILYWDNVSKKLHTFDGRETAPQASTPNMFLENGEAMKWRDAVVGGKSVGVPGVLKALQMAHNKFGALKWEILFDDAIKQSREGFIVSPRLAKLVNLDLHPGLTQFAESRAYFKPQGVFINTGDTKKNMRLASTFEKIAKGGADAFYKGAIAEKMVQKVSSVSINPGKLSVKDLADYTAIERLPMCNPYREFNICGMAPPSSGGVSVYKILKSLEGFNLNKHKHDSLEFVHLFAQSSALAFADRDMYIADLDFLGVPVEPLVNADYIRSRATQISLNKPFKKATAGKPYTHLKHAKDNAYELNSTTHIAIVDKQGNAVSMTSSVEFMFGSGIMVEGFLLNNQLTDFSLNPSRGNLTVLNRVQANKRPRSAMSPTMVFDDSNKLILIVGSPGGSRIINYVAQTIFNVLDFKMGIQEAINAPKFTNRNKITTLEKGTSIVALQKRLESKGHEVRVADLNSGLHGIEIIDGKLHGGADPRREGVVLGQ